MNYHLAVGEMAASRLPVSVSFSIFIEAKASLLGSRTIQR
jgi:hypothetical protein